MADLWESWTILKEEVKSCTIITTDPNELMLDIQDRMPVILSIEDERKGWTRINQLRN
ncbi:hypothetical protein EHS13_15500 [Paenibacillus psychroresistens]|uniref:Uncharacterized protein n=2 Tax=Paenibacillus psychroresistens TaxID=1778678 RepID=A0A6B8RKR0_9BACL|nr:hypothetical protein EHS13_15500 [Paenibacillus psychroresistens]